MLSFFSSPDRASPGGEGDPPGRGAGCGSAGKARLTTPAPVYGARALHAPERAAGPAVSGRAAGPRGDVCTLTGVQAGSEHAESPGFAVTRRLCERGVAGPEARGASWRSQKEENIYQSSDEPETGEFGEDPLHRSPGIFGHLAARDDQFAGSEEEDDHLGVVEPVYKTRKLLGLVLDLVQVETHSNLV